MNLEKNNYFSPEAMTGYMSVSQFKEFLDCPARMMAELSGEYVRDDTTALLVGSYVDAYFSGELEDFMAEHPEIMTKKGDLRADYQRAGEIIERAESDEFFMSYLDAPATQAILTGELLGHPWKVKVDALHDDKIVDLKVMKDMEPVWKDGERKSFIDAWGYALQGYVYREIVSQHVGKKLPFYLAVITKEKEPDLAVIEIPDWRLNSEAAVVEHYIGEYAAVKEGLTAPRRCGVCAYCRRTKKLNRVTGYEKLIEKMEATR